MDEYIENGNPDKIRDFPTAPFAGITYTLESDLFEHYFQVVTYLTFKLIGKFTIYEMYTYTGRFGTLEP